MERTTRLLCTPLLLLLFASSAWPIESRNEFDTGRRCYDAGKFKTAISHFKKAVSTDPIDAASYFWLGKSYEMLADIDGPVLGGRTSSKARLSLTKAVELAPANREYRRELFDFLLASDRSPGALHQAERIIQTTPRSDPDYPFLSTQLENERIARSSPESRITAAFGLLEQPLAGTGLSLASIRGRARGRSARAIGALTPVSSRQNGTSSSVTPKPSNSSSPGAPAAPAPFPRPGAPVRAPA